MPILVQNDHKWFENFDIFHKRHKGNKGARLQKMYVRLWDFGTLKSHSLKVSVQIFTIFQHLRYRRPMVTFGMSAKWKTSTAGVERCQIDTCNTKKKRQSRVRIQFLAAWARLFLISLHSNDCFERNRRRKNLPARWRSRQEFR